MISADFDVNDWAISLRSSCSLLRNTLFLGLVRLCWQPELPGD